MDFSAESLKARRQWDNIIKVYKKNKNLLTKNIIATKTVLLKMRE